MRSKSHFGRTLVIDDCLVYEITQIREGGMANVLMLIRKSPSDGPSEKSIYLRRVAAKTFKDEFDTESMLQGLFERELNIWIDLDAPNTVPLLAVKKVRHKLYALMPQYESSLRDRIALHGRLRPQIARNCLISAIECLRWAYEKRSLLHQDLKPDNLLFPNKSSWSAHVSDWGIATILSSMAEKRSSLDHHKPGAFLNTMSNAGTLPYMSPRRIQGMSSKVQDDIYSLGLIYYESLTGQLPFVDPTNNPLELQIVGFDYYRHAFAMLRSNPLWVNDAPIVMRCLEPNPSNAYSNYNSLLADFRRLDVK